MILELSQFRLETHETVLSFKNKIRKHVLKADIDDQEMVKTYFVEGLLDSMKDIVRGHGNKTFEAEFAVANSPCRMEDQHQNRLQQLHQHRHKNPCVPLCSLCIWFRLSLATVGDPTVDHAMTILPIATAEGQPAIIDKNWLTSPTRIQTVT